MIKKMCLSLTLLLSLLATSCGGLRDLSSRPVDDPLAAFPGRTQVLVYWNVACPYCEQELAEVEAAHDRWCAMGIGVVAIDVGDPSNDVLKTVQARGYSFPILSGAGWDDLAARAVPYTVVHVDGRVVGRRIGYVSAIEIENILRGGKL
jgi:thiol-disulfide isomerase/thioredoxin